MRLMELIEDPLTAKIKSAISVMKARSKTVGEPYSVSYDRLAKMIDFPGNISKSDIESAINSDPDIAPNVLNFSEDSLKVDANAPADMGMGDMGMGMTPTPGIPNGEGPDVSGQPFGQDMTGGMPGADMMGGMPGADMTGMAPAEAPPSSPQINQAGIVKQLATSAKNRRLK